MTKRITAMMLAMSALLFSTPAGSQAATYQCATVEIEIHQELTMERQAFQAEMTIDNGFEGLDLTNVTVNMVFMDEAGKRVSQ